MSVKEGFLTAETLRKVLFYDPETGAFTRLSGGRSRPDLVGTKAGSARQRDGRTYVTISVACVDYQAHRLAWLYMTGVWPSKFIDHINGDGADNRFANLREATPSENARNAKTRRTSRVGLKGVRISRVGRFEAWIYIRGKSVSLGTFKTEQSAHVAYVKAAKEHFGTFARLA